MFRRYKTTPEKDSSGNILYRIHQVPIFAPMYREDDDGAGGPMDYNEEWINTAVTEGNRRQHEEGSLPTLYLEHPTNKDKTPSHLGEWDEETNRQVAGFMENQEVKKIMYRGEPTPVIFTDLVIVSKDVFDQMYDANWPGISVEISHTEENNPQAITSAALLNVEPSAVKFPPLVPDKPRELVHFSEYRVPEGMDPKKAFAGTVVCFSETPRKIRELQTIVVPKAKAKSRIQAERIASKYGTPGTIRETSTSYRFRQETPRKMQKDEYKTDKKRDASLVYSKRKQKASEEFAEEPRERLEQKAKMGDPEAITKLNRLKQNRGEDRFSVIAYKLESPYEYERKAGIEGLKRLGSDKAISAISDILLNDKSVEVKGLAAHALGQMGNKSAIPVLLKASDSNDFLVSFWAKKSLEDLGYKPDTQTEYAESSSLESLVREFNQSGDLQLLKKIASLDARNGGKLLNSLRDFQEASKKLYDYYKETDPLNYGPEKSQLSDDAMWKRYEVSKIADRLDIKDINKSLEQLKYVPPLGRLKEYVPSVIFAETPDPKAIKKKTPHERYFAKEQNKNPKIKQLRAEWIEAKNKIKRASAQKQNRFNRLLRHIEANGLLSYRDYIQTLLMSRKGKEAVIDEIDPLVWSKEPGLELSAKDLAEAKKDYQGLIDAQRVIRETESPTKLLLALRKEEAKLKPEENEMQEEFAEEPRERLEQRARMGEPDAIAKLKNLETRTHGVSDSLQKAFDNTKELLEKKEKEINTLFEMLFHGPDYISYDHPLAQKFLDIYDISYYSLMQTRAEELNYEDEEEDPEYLDYQEQNEEAENEARQILNEARDGIKKAKDSMTSVRDVDFEQIVDTLENAITSGNDFLDDVIEKIKKYVPEQEEFAEESREDLERQLKLDPGNTILQRKLQRLKDIRGEGGDELADLLKEAKSAKSAAIPDLLAKTLEIGEAETARVMSELDAYQLSRASYGLEDFYRSNPGVLNEFFNRYSDTLGKGDYQFFLHSVSSVPGLRKNPAFAKAVGGLLDNPNADMGTRYSATIFFPFSRNEDLYLQKLKSGTEKDKEIALNAIENERSSLSQKTIKALERLMTKGDINKSKVARDALGILIRRGNKNAEQIVRASLKSTNRGDNFIGLLHGDKIKSPEVLEDTAKFLYSDDSSILSNAVENLGNSGDKSFIPAIKTRLSNLLASDKEMLRSVDYYFINALQDLGDTSSSDLVRKVVSLSEKDDSVRMAANRYLRQAGEQAEFSEESREEIERQLRLDPGNTMLQRKLEILTKRSGTSLNVDQGALRNAFKSALDRGYSNNAKKELVNVFRNGGYDKNVIYQVNQFADKVLKNAVENHRYYANFASMENLLTPEQEAQARRSSDQSGEPSFASWRSLPQIMTEFNRKPYSVNRRNVENARERYSDKFADLLVDKFNKFFESGEKMTAKNRPAGQWLDEINFSERSGVGLRKSKATSSMENNMLREQDEKEKYMSGGTFAEDGDASSEPLEDISEEIADLPEPFQSIYSMIAEWDEDKIEMLKAHIAEMNDEGSEETEIDLDSEMEEYGEKSCMEEDNMKKKRFGIDNSPVSFSEKIKKMPSRYQAVFSEMDRKIKTLESVNRKNQDREKLELEIKRQLANATNREKIRKDVLKEFDSKGLSSAMSSLKLVASYAKSYPNPIKEDMSKSEPKEVDTVISKYSETEEMLQEAERLANAWNPERTNLEKEEYVDLGMKATFSELRDKKRTKPTKINTLKESK